MVKKDINDQLRLKPCPCCGGEARLVELHRGFISTEFWVECTKCELHTGGSLDGKTSEIRAWNRRSK